jgi:hypothetical protein
MEEVDGSLPKLCPAVTLSHQDGHHSAVALLLKAALIQLSDYRLLWFLITMLRINTTQNAKSHICVAFNRINMYKCQFAQRFNYIYS